MNKSITDKYGSAIRKGDLVLIKIGRHDDHGTLCTVTDLPGPYGQFCIVSPLWETETTPLGYLPSEIAVMNMDRLAKFIKGDSQ